MSAIPSSIRSEISSLLAAHVRSLELNDFDDLWSRFTEEHDSWFRRTPKVRAKRLVPPRRIQGESGSDFDLEEWAVIEDGRSLHIFVSIWSIDYPDIEVNEDIILHDKLCRQIAEVLASEDVMNITVGNPDPVGEYAGEAAEIVRRVRVGVKNGQSTEPVHIAGVVREVFRREFDQDIGAGYAREIADRLKPLLRSLS
ncbi:MAG TPA: hypothetical protein VFW48_07880 [Solirubrobacterales bacterium]|nr:hypothetical protein [Solirubrobacterales bacterium]